jgi:predicted DNA-binding transcriptional regulator YafY
MKKETGSRLCLERLTKIVNRFVLGREINVRLLAEEFETCQKTICRDFDFMRDRLGVEIEYNFSTRRWRLGKLSTPPWWMAPSLIAAETNPVMD